MRQGHEVFILAKVNDRYRTLAAGYNESMYGLETIRKVLHLVEIFNAEANQIGIYRELRKAERIDWNTDVTGEGDQASSSVFPFIATCLLMALRNLYDQNAYVELCPIDVAYNYAEPKDGISVVDITDLSNIRCSFLCVKDADFSVSDDEDSEDEEDNEGREEIESHEDIEYWTKCKIAAKDVILNAIGYIRQYHGRNRFSKEQLSTISRCRALPTVGIAPLKSRWPEVSWYGDVDEEDGSFANSPQRQTPNLKGMSITRLLEEGLHNDTEDRVWLSHAEEMQDFNGIVRRRLFDNPALVRLPSGINLLAHVLKDQRLLDLSPFTQLEPADIIYVLGEMKSDQDFEKQLYLPDLQNISEQELAHIVSLVSLRELHLGDTGIHLQKLLGLAVNARVSTFTCPALYKRALDLRSRKDAITFHGGKYISNKLTVPQIPAEDFAGVDASQFPITQIIYLRQFLFPGYPQIDEGGIRWSQLSLPFKGDRDRTRPGDQPDIMVFPMRDGMISRGDVTNRLSVVLPRILATTDHNLFVQQFWAGEQMTGLAKEFSIDESNRILPIPAECYAAYKSMISLDATLPPLVQELKPGYWTLFFLHEKPCEYARRLRRGEMYGPAKLRYAFATVDESDKLRVLAANNFFQEESPSQLDEGLVSEWNAKMVEMENLMTVSTHGINNGQPSQVSAANSTEVGEVLRMIRGYNTSIIRACRRKEFARICGFVPASVQALTERPAQD